MYLDHVVTAIRKHIPEDRMPDGDADELLRIYAVLVRAKGVGVTDSDVHDAWSAWMAERDSTHAALVPYEDLDVSTRRQDAVFTAAIRNAAVEQGPPKPTNPSFVEVLFPSGPPDSPAEIQQTVDLYKIMVQSSESLVGRRQGVNTFFLTMNGALLTASGLVVQSSGGSGLGVLGVAVLAVAGAILCRAWSSLITSFGQLNRGKFQVINTIERHLKAAIYAAEWEALGRGEDPRVYRAFTSREIWVPNALLTLHVVTAIAATVVATKPYWSHLWPGTA
jgi:hypothetical protein